MEKPGGLQSVGLQRIGHEGSNISHSTCVRHWARCRYLRYFSPHVMKSKAKKNAIIFLRTKVLSLSFMTNTCSFYIFQFLGAASSGFQYVRFALFPAHFALFFPLPLMLLFPTLFITLNTLCISLFQSFIAICSRILSPFPSCVLLILQY